MSDDTQNPNTEPGDPTLQISNAELLRTPQAYFDAPETESGIPPDVSYDVPPLVVSQNYVETNEPLHLPGRCVVGDGLSDVVSTPPGGDALEWERIVGICQTLQRNQTIIWRVEELLGLHAIGDNRDRIGAIAKSLSCRKQFIENAEHLTNMGS